MLTARSFLSTARTIARSTVVTSRGLKLFPLENAKAINGGGKVFFSSQVKDPSKDANPDEEVVNGSPVRGENVIEEDENKAAEDAMRKKLVGIINEAEKVARDAKQSLKLFEADHKNLTAGNVEADMIRVTFSRSDKVKSLLKAGVDNLYKGDSVEAAKSLSLAGYITVKDFIAEMEKKTGVKITESGSKEWSYTRLDHFCFLLCDKLSSSVSDKILSGEFSVSRMQASVYEEEEMDVEDVQRQLNKVIMFIETMENEVEVNTNIAQYLKKRLQVQV